MTEKIINANSDAKNILKNPPIYDYLRR